MNDIEQAIAGPLDVGTAVNREVLKAAVMRQIMCPRSGAVLDIRSAVYFSVTTKAGKTAAEVVDGEAWDAIKGPLQMTCTEYDITLEVIDGREVNSKPERKAK